jgi:hypothetical protein
VDREGRLKLMDFGIARGEESRLTLEGMVFGTPSYTAPELLVGGEASPATDRWAFTVSAFEALTGALPFHGETVGATLHAIVHEGPRFPQECSPAFREVFLRALAKAPAARHPGLELFLHELLEALELPEAARRHLHALVSGDSPFAWDRPFRGEASPPLEPLPLELGSPDPRKGPWFRRPWGLGLLALAALACAVAVALRSRREPWTLDVATTPPRAELFLDGRYRGQTPLRIPLARGQGHLLRAEREGFEPAIREAREGEWDLHLVLRPVPRLLTVISEPSGAEVLLDGRAVGKTPIRALPVPREGRHELRIRRKGWEDWSSALEGDTPLPAVVRLRPRR